ncbi:hypothetical protein AAHH79_44140, partial [Burkholderia pseudomallei]
LAAFGALIALALVVAAWEWGRLLQLGGAGPLAYAAVAALARGASTRLGIGAAAAGGGVGGGGGGGGGGGARGGGGH